MANSTTNISLQEKQKARNAYRQARSQRRAINAELEQPEVAGIVDPADGTLNKDVLLGATFDLTLQAWKEQVTQPGDYDTLFVDFAAGTNPDPEDYGLVHKDTITAPVADDTFPMLIKIPLGNLVPGFEKPRDGPYRLRYRVVQMNGQETVSSPFPLIVDTTPPLGHLEPQSMTLTTVQLTQDFIDNNPGGLTGTLPDYDDWQVGDKVAFYWVTSPLPEDPDDLPSAVDVIPVSAANGNKVIYPLTAIEGSEDKDYYALYILLDKATNRSPVSAYTRVDVALGALPASLQDPLVPLATPPAKLINMADARVGVEVHIPSFNNWKPTDRIEVTWGKTALRAVEMGEAPGFPFSIPVPRLTLRDEYNFTGSGVQSTNVSYRVMRGVLPSEVKATNVNVDFSYVGPDPAPNPDPDWPDPVNDQLEPAEVSGKTSQTENVLDPSDNGQPAELKFKLYTPLNAAEIIDFYWGTQAVPDARYEVKDDDTAGKEITREIPWSYIESEGNNPALPVHYRIHAADSENTQHSPDTLVDVSAIVITPDAPTFEGLSDGGWLNCNSLFKDPANPAAGEPGVRVVVPDLTKYLMAGDTVTLNWKAYTRPGDVFIPDTDKCESITLDATTVEGFTWLVTPYADHILPTYNPAPGHGNSGIGVISYSFELNGNTVTSKETEANVGMYDANGSCPVP
jgi:hypothetical protein